MNTFEDGIAAVDAIAAEFGITSAELRPFASRHLSEEMPGLEEIGSSDVSCHLSSLGNYRPELLREEASRIAELNELVRQVAISTGQSEADALRGMRALFAPIDGPSTTTGYQCKQCSNPSPVGVGYKNNQPVTGDLDSCLCGYSRNPN